MISMALFVYGVRVIGLSKSGEKGGMGLIALSWRCWPLFVLMTANFYGSGGAASVLFLTYFWNALAALSQPC